MNHRIPLLIERDPLQLRVGHGEVRELRWSGLKKEKGKKP
jgi:hypothetical protein